MGALLGPARGSEGIGFTGAVFGVFSLLRPDCATATVARPTASIRKTTDIDGIFSRQKSIEASAFTREPEEPALRRLFPEAKSPIPSMLFRLEDYAGHAFYVRACDLVPATVPAARK